MGNKISKSEEEKIIETTKKQVAAKKLLRIISLAYGLVGIGLCVFAGVETVSKLQDLPTEELTNGFVTGFALSVIASTFGMMGVIGLTKAFIGFADDFKDQELLLIYHKRLYGDDKSE